MAATDPTYEEMLRYAVNLLGRPMQPMERVRAFRARFPGVGKGVPVAVLRDAKRVRARYVIETMPGTLTEIAASYFRLYTACEAKGDHKTALAALRELAALHDGHELKDYAPEALAQQLIRLIGDRAEEMSENMLISLLDSVKAVIVRRSAVSDDRLAVQAAVVDDLVAGAA